MARLAAGLSVLLFGAGALAVAQAHGTRTTYAGSSPEAAVLTAVAGFALVLAAAFLSSRRSSMPLSGLALLAAIAWFAPIWVGWNGGLPLARSLAMLAAGFLFPLLVHIVLAYPDGHVRTRTVRVLVGVAYAETALATIALTLVRDPFFDPICWANCTDNVFLIHSLPNVARAVEVMHRWLTVAVAAALAAVCAWRVLKDSWPARRGLLPVAGPAIVLAAGAAAHSLALNRPSPEDPSDPMFFGVFLITSAAVTLLSAGLAWGALRARLQRRAVARIVASLGEAPAAGSVEAALAHAVGDPQLRIAYWLPTAQRFVDARGRSIAESADIPGRSITALVRDDRRVALVSHAARLPAIESELGPAVRLALENERLQAEALAQLDELRASRTRIVQTGDAERRRLERDLHDGAQQRLLAVSYDIRRALASAEADHDAHAASLLAAALVDVQAALDELRELAHGIYPAILAESGLAAALQTLADTAPLHLEVRDVTEDRYPSAVETAAHVLVVEAVDSAAARDATHAAVTAVRSQQHLLVTVEDDGSDRTSPMMHAADRVGALGGTLTVGARVATAEIPCE